MRSLIYHDTDLRDGLKKLQQFAFYYPDITKKGKICEKSTILSFDMLIATSKALMQDDCEFIKQVPFLHIIVDDAHIPANLKCISKLACKRITLSTSNPMPNNSLQLFNLISSIQPALKEDERLTKHFNEGIFSLY